MMEITQNYKILSYVTVAANKRSKNLEHMKPLTRVHLLHPPFVRVFARPSLSDLPLPFVQNALRHLAERSGVGLKWKGRLEGWNRNAKEWNLEIIYKLAESYLKMKAGWDYPEVILLSGRRNHRADKEMMSALWLCRPERSMDEG